MVGGASRSQYTLQGRLVAQWETPPGGASTLVYLHGDHLGSVSVATSASGAVVSRQEFDPWGQVRSGGIGQTTLNYTGQRKDGTGLLYYQARYYDPGIGRFLSADSIVPGTQRTVLTVDFHEPGFVAKLDGENSFTQEHGFWFQLDSRERQQAKVPWGPPNPQTLNRYAYSLNNPLRYIDPNGHNAWAVEALYWAFRAAGIAVSSALLPEIAVAFTVSAVVACLARSSCRNGVADLVERGYQTASEFVKGLGHVLRASESQSINITPDGIAHVRETHTSGGEYSGEDKGIFYDWEDPDDLIRQAEGVKPYEQENGRWARVVKAGRPIGVDQTGTETDIYTVITTREGDLVTAFPGSP